MSRPVQAGCIVATVRCGLSSSSSICLFPSSFLRLCVFLRCFIDSGRRQRPLRSPPIVASAMLSAHVLAVYVSFDNYFRDLVTALASPAGSKPINSPVGWGDECKNGFLIYCKIEEEVRRGE